MKKLLTIDGMACGHCTMKVKSELMGVAGVTAVEVDLLKRSAMVSGDNLIDTGLSAAVVRAGYRVTRIIGNH
jgi:copper chaperone CopZ